MAIGAPRCTASPVICSQNDRHRSAGSGPSTRITSVPGSEADHTPTVGHTISRWRCAVSRTCGRTVAKSVYGSGSISASAVAELDSTRVRNAMDAASPASFQPGERGHDHRVPERRFGEPTDVLHVGVNPTGAPSAVSSGARPQSSGSMP